MKPPPSIVLTTDFGLADPYVGVMKGVILGISPQARIIDLTHQVQPQDLRQAAFILGTSHRFFPIDTIHVVVVDPGVGTDRKAVLLVTPRAKFLAPDNGVLSYVLPEHLDDAPAVPGVVPVPSDCTAFQLTNPQYWLDPVSNTFHGRDVFAPVAAHLSLGVTAAAVGAPLVELVWLPRPRPRRDGAHVIGEVVYADHFGNLITSIPGEMLGKPDSITVRISGRRIAGLSDTFHDRESFGSEELVALVGSNGYLEIAVPNGSAAETLHAGPGEPVRVSAA